MDMLYIHFFDEKTIICGIIILAVSYFTKQIQCNQ